MLKILNVTFTTRWGGLEQAFLNYNKMLDKTADIKSVIHKKSTLTRHINNDDYKLNNFSKYDPFTRFKLKKILRLETPDFIFTHGNRAHYLVSKSAKSSKVIGVAHGYSFDFIKNCDYIFAVSKDIKNTLEKNGYPKSKIFHIPNIINDDNFEALYEESQKAQEALLNKKFEIPTIGVMSRIEKEKGLDIFIKAMSVLKKNKIHFKAIIAGIGSEFDNIKNLIKELNLVNEIKLLGFVSNKEEFYKKIDILCVPSLMEPFGIVILEGFLFGKPVISSSASGPLEIIKNKKDGFIFPKGNYKELANCIKYLIKNQSVIPGIVEEALKKVKLYGVKNTSTKLVKILEKIKDKNVG